MSIWTYIEGMVEIPVNEKISLSKVIEEVFGDEYRLKIDTQNSADTFCHVHRIDLNICVEGETFLDNYKKFLKLLKPRQIDLACEIRLSDPDYK